MHLCSPRPGTHSPSCPPTRCCPPGAHVLDAGCGLGHGLQALRRAYPQAQLHGMEWSWPLRLLCGVVCPLGQRAPC